MLLYGTINIHTHIPKIISASKTSTLSTRPSHNKRDDTFKKILKTLYSTVVTAFYSNIYKSDKKILRDDLDM